ncbi:WD40-repeat-containing domain protein [Lactarius psammicola]|nr:WD40-repeat-containing domain protein [Lactarius psammicola]
MAQPLEYQERYHQPAHEASITCMALSLDGHRLVTGSIDCTVLVWSVQSGRALCRLKSHSPVLSVVWLRNSNGFLFGCKNGMMASVDISERFVKTTFFRGHSTPIHCLSPKFNNLFPISGAMDEVKIWKLESWELKVKLPPPSVIDLRRVVEVTSVNWQSEDAGTSASLAIVSYRLHGILCWDVAGMTVLWQFPIDECVTLSLSPDGRLAATAGRARNFEIRDLESGAVQSLQWQVRTKPAMAPHSVRDLKMGTVTTQEEVQMKFPKMSFQRVCFAHEGFAVAGAGGDNKVHVWDAERGDQLMCLEHGEDFRVDALVTVFLEKDDQFLIVTATENSGKSHIFLWATVPSVVTTSTSSYTVGSDRIELNFPRNFWIHVSFLVVVVALLFKW